MFKVQLTLSGQRSKSSTSKFSSISIYPVFKYFDKTEQICLKKTQTKIILLIMITIKIKQINTKTDGLRIQSQCQLKRQIPNGAQYFKTKHAVILLGRVHFT